MVVVVSVTVASSVAVSVRDVVEDIVTDPVAVTSTGIAWVKVNVAVVWAAVSTVVE